MQFTIPGLLLVLFVVFTPGKCFDYDPDEQYWWDTSDVFPTDPSDVLPSDPSDVLPSDPSGTDGQSGTPGPSGPAGPRGPRGPTGTAGTAGTAGLAGPPGPPGQPGDDGNTGNAGAHGLPGLQGARGIPGRDGLTGAAGQHGPPGPPGTCQIQGCTPIESPIFEAHADSVKSDENSSSYSGDNKLLLFLCMGLHGLFLIAFLILVLLLCCWRKDYLQQRSRSCCQHNQCQQRLQPSVAIIGQGPPPYVSKAESNVYEHIDHKI